MTRAFEGSGAVLVGAPRLESFRLATVTRRRHDRSVRRFARPDAEFAGVLAIEDGATFSRALARGLGRHRSFGFGMILLRPAG